MDIDINQAGSLMMIPYIITGILCPIFGWMTDKYGKRIHFLLMAIAFLIAFYVFFYFLPPNTEN